MFPRIDAHHHLWNYNGEEFGWIDDSMARLRADFLPSHLIELMDDAGVDLAVAVQARQSMEETRWLLQLASKNSRIAGVVGWAAIADAGFDDILETLQSEPKLVGLRHIVQTEPDDFLDEKAFNSGIKLLEKAGLAYDILIYESQLPATIRFVDRHPNQRFVVDHCAKPRIGAQEIDYWHQNISELALRPNVFCKVSGLATEADWATWSLETLRPYLDIVLEVFGTGRLMAGSDWPVSLLATSYSCWWQTLRVYAATLTISEQQDLFGGTAQKFYKLQLSDRGTS